MSEILNNLGAQALMGSYKLIDTIDTTLSVIGLGPTVSLKNQKRSKREAYIVKAIQVQQWSQVESLIHKVTSNEACLLIDNVTGHLSKTANIELWAEFFPDNYWAQLFCGNRLIHSAWDARGSGDSSTVSTGMAEKFWEQLYLAKETLQRACDIRPDSTEAYSALIIVEMGLGYDNAELWQHFIQLCKQEPKHYIGHCNMLHALCEKWGGSHNEMFDIAIKGCLNEPEGSFMYGLVPMAHIERWLYFLMCGDDAEGNQYFYREDVVDEIVESYGKYQNKTDSQRSIINFDILNKFAFCFYMSGFDEKAKELFKVIGYNATNYPWMYHDEPFLTSFDAGHSYSLALSKVGVKKAALSKKI